MRVPIPSVVIAVVVCLLYAFVPGVKEKPWTALRVTGALIALVGFVLALVARAQLGKSFTVTPQARALVTHGLYSRLRNPIYLFVDLMLVGLILFFGYPILLVFVMAFGVFQSIQAHREAKVLQAKFGQAYLDYRKQTWF